MNPLAKELNETLAGSAMFELLSPYGRRFYFPKGIITQAAEAKQHAHRFDATVGLAVKDGQPLHLEEIASHFSGLSPGELFSYAPTPGDPRLRERWRDEMLRKNPTLAGKAISQPLVVPGLTAGISILADLFFDTGDEVVIPDMFWGNYRLIFEGRKQSTVKRFSFYYSDAFNLDAMDQAVRESAADGRTPEGNSKAAIVLNFPNNPTGYSPTVSEAAEICRRLTAIASEGVRLLVICDDAYFGLFYEQDTYRQSLFAELADAHPNLLAIKVDGATKEDFVWGFRLGFVTFGCAGADAGKYQALEKKLGGAVRAAVSNSSRPAQSLLLKALETPTYPDEKQAAFELLRERYRAVRRVLEQHALPRGVRVLPFNSGYFMTFELESGGAENLRRKILHERGIGTISIEDRYLRVAFAGVDLQHIEELYSEIFAAIHEVC